MQVSLQFNAFDVQSTLNCKSDYIRVYDGTSKSSPLILDRTCGTGLPPVLVASTNRMLVEFVSDDSVAGVGFKASYTTVKCGGTFYTTSRNVTSSNYPKAYNPNQDCLYLITAPTSYKVALKINYFFLEFGSSCQYDYLTIRNGDSESAPYMGVSEKYCGYRFFDTLVSDGNSMLLKFHSDYSGQATGFSASYTYVPSS
ncbi:hypothetical protein GDO86_008815 [Hymenochirus boettgeri]|uniref:CUB domain-containing protein n=1 Tax=Hymenochirus boettgeri TaxID=247094 RepID=A0A8T2J6G8_9PIPI|nr:hypothetical protein GDO86_008815 [Hymenochirus boettgeri]